MVGIVVLLFAIMIFGFSFLIKTLNRLMKEMECLHEELEEMKSRSLATVIKKKKTVTIDKTS